MNRIKLQKTIGVLFVISGLVTCSGVKAAEPTAGVAGGKKGAIERVVFVGDSITCGVGVPDKSKRYSTVATGLLKERFPEITEVNCGQSGRALCQQSTSYVDEILKQKPDAVVVQWGVNDQFWGFSVARYAECYDHFVSGLRAANPEMPIVLTTLIADFRWPENSDAWISEANVAIQEIAAHHSCCVADLHRAINHDKKFYADSIHPNAAGADVMAKGIAEAFNSPPKAGDPVAVQFDQGGEVRFMQYIFTPRRQGTEPQWIRVSEISPKGMRIETQVPLSIRTAPGSPKGSSVVIKDKAGVVMTPKDVKDNWGGFHIFTLDPAGHEGPFAVEIVAGVEKK